MAEFSAFINSAGLSSSALLTSLSACIVKSNCSVCACIVQTMTVLLEAMLFGASKHCIEPRGSLENALVDKTAFLHVSGVSVSFQVWFTMKSHRGGVRKWRSHIHVFCYRSFSVNILIWTFVGYVQALNLVCREQLDSHALCLPHDLTQSDVWHLRAARSSASTPTHRRKAQKRQIPLGFPRNVVVED